MAGRKLRTVKHLAFSGRRVIIDPTPTAGGSDERFNFEAIVSPMAITSPLFCQRPMALAAPAGNQSPHFAWSARPPALSFALTCFDLDAPTSGFWHWVAVNIPADVSALALNASAAGAMPAGALETRTDFLQPGYGGCPPPGDHPHRYILRSTRWG